MLIADIGGTRARFALSPTLGQLGDVLELSTDAQSFEDALAEALAVLAPDVPPLRAAFAVAGTEQDGRVPLTNAGWVLDAAAIQAAFDFESVTLINDFEAIAHALPILRDEDRQRLGSGVPEADAPMLVLGPGTGLGVASAVPDFFGNWRVLSGEGGHVTLAARTDAEASVLAALRSSYAHVSAERVLSGPGLSELHETLCGESRSAASIATAANAGNAKALASVRMFTGFLATVAGDAALTLGARGGVYLTGGVLAGLGDSFDAAAFLARFADKGRFADYLSAIPVYRIGHAQPGLLGLTTLRG